MYIYIFLSAYIYIYVCTYACIRKQLYRYTYVLYDRISGRTITFSQHQILTTAAIPTYH